MTSRLSRGCGVQSLTAEVSAGFANARAADKVSVSRAKETNSSRFIFDLGSSLTADLGEPAFATRQQQIRPSNDARTGNSFFNPARPRVEFPGGTRAHGNAVRLLDLVERGADGISGGVVGAPVAQEAHLAGGAAGDEFVDRLRTEE